MERRLTRFGVEEVVQMRHNRHGCASPLITRSVQNESGDAQRTMERLQYDTPRAMART